MTNFITRYALILCLLSATAASPAWASNPPKPKKSDTPTYELNEKNSCKLPVYLGPSSNGWTWDTSLEVMPLDGVITSGFGSRRAGKRATRYHKGIDISAPRGSAIVASADGAVIFVGVRRGYGKVVDIDHGGGVVTRYAHMETVDVQEGEKVKAGQKIAYVGRTGRTTGACLHFETIINGKQVDPLTVCQWATFLADSGKFKKSQFPVTDRDITVKEPAKASQTTVAASKKGTPSNKKSTQGKATKSASKNNKNNKNNKELRLASKKNAPPAGYVNTLP